MRQELCGLESAVALCERCFGPERRMAVRFERPPGPVRVLLLGERPPRAVLQSEERLGLHNDDPGTRFLRERLRDAGIPADAVVLGAAVMCRPASRRLESAVGAGVCVKECAGHVRELVRVVEPQLVVPLGKSALRSLRWAFPEEEELSSLRFPESVGATVRLSRFRVHPLYHVTPRARLCRPDAQQRRDWESLGRAWTELAEAPPDGEEREAAASSA